MQVPVRVLKILNDWNGAKRLNVLNVWNGPIPRMRQPQLREWHKVIYQMQRALAPEFQEYRIDFGPGYRIYFGRDGDHLVILLAGGTKKRQQDDIRHARELWTDYKRRSKKEK